MLGGDISGGQYGDLQMKLEREAARLKPVKETFEVVEGTTSKRTVVSASRSGEVIPQDEWRLYLLNNWSLYDAVLHSDYCFSALSLHKSRDRMHHMFAKMGVPLSETKQPYAFMKPVFRNTLKQQLKQHAPDYGLTDLTYKGFTLVTGFSSTVAASDVCYAMMAIMETGRTENDKTKINMALDCMAHSRRAHGKEGQDLTNLVNGGTVAHSGLSHGLQLAKANQRAVMTAAIGLVEKNEIVTYKHFRFAYLHATSAGSTSSTINHGSGAAAIAAAKATANPLANPGVLRKLSAFLMEMHRAGGKWAGRKAKPLILLAEVPSSESYVVSAYNCAHARGAVSANRFGRRFALAAEKTGREGECEVRRERFDDWVVDVPRHLVNGFVHQLHMQMDF